MFRRRGKAPRRSELTAFIDEGSEIEGRYTFRGTVMLNGKFKGEISSNDTLIIGERAVLQADVRAGRLVVNGEVTGNLSAMERIGKASGLLQSRLTVGAHLPFIWAVPGLDEARFQS